jgi:hypothetical protein
MRSFFQTCLLVGLLVFMTGGLTPNVGQAADDSNARQWPTFRLPDRVIVQARPRGFALRVVQNTLAGLLAHRVRQKRTGTMLWVDKRHPAYQRWQKRWAERTGVKIEKTNLDVWQLVQSSRAAGLVHGYVLYKQDTDTEEPHDVSVNLATSLCAPLGAIAVDESLEAKARAIGLKPLADVRGKDFAWLIKHYGNRLSKRYVALLKPDNDHMRDLCVALGAPVSFDNEAGGYLQAIARADANAGAVAFGWGKYGEFKSVSAASKKGMPFLPADFTLNLPVLLSGESGLARPAKTISKAPALKPTDPAKRYVAFMLSDGDNMAWAMDNLTASRNAWANKARGTLPFGWTVPWVHGRQLCPDILDYMASDARPGDDLIPFGGGYMYLDLFGQQSGTQDALALEAKRINTYLKHGQRKVMISFAKSWKSDAAKTAYQSMAQNAPDLKGLFILQFAPYAAGKGEILWAPRPKAGDFKISALPILSAKASIWNHKKNNPVAGQPGHVAQLINTWAGKAVTKPEDQFTWVVVHVWSTFEDPKTGKKISGYDAAVRCAADFDKHVVVITPSELVERLIERKNKQAQ